MVGLVARSWKAEITRPPSQGGGRLETFQQRIPSLVTCVNVSGILADNNTSDVAYQGQTVSLFPLIIDLPRRIRIPLQWRTR